MGELKWQVREQDFKNRIELTVVKGSGIIDCGGAVWMIRVSKKISFEWLFGSFEKRRARALKKARKLAGYWNLTDDVTKETLHK